MPEKGSLISDNIWSDTLNVFNSFQFTQADEPN